MVRYMSENSSTSEPRTTAKSSIVLEKDNSIVFNKSRTCINENDLISVHSYKNIIPFSELPIVCAKTLSVNGNSEDMAQEKLEKLRKFRKLREESVMIEQCRDLSDIQICLQEKEFIENVKMFNKDFD